MLTYDLPLSEIVMDFHDSLKTISSGYASFDYEDNGFHQSPLVKVLFTTTKMIIKRFYISFVQMCILLNGVLVDELSNIVHVSRVQLVGRKLVLKLKDIIPRQMVQIAIQATVNGKVVARETLKAYRKDVTAKLVRISFLKLSY